jgi:hypothetical protein
MQADFAVECGAGDECLEMPWRTTEGSCAYVDVKRQPERLSEIEEVAQFPELGAFLRSMNSPRSSLETAKCDAWFTRELQPEEEIFGVGGKFGSYVDLLFVPGPRRADLGQHESFARSLTQLLARAPEMPASAEFLVRRCLFRATGEHTAEVDGFYITVYVFGYADDEVEARRHWGIALDLVRNAILQAAAKLR